MVSETQMQPQEEMFSNEQITQHDLPQLEGLSLEPISLKYRTMNLFFVGVFATILITIVSALRFNPFFDLPEDLAYAYPFIVAVIGFLGTLWFTYHWFADTKIKYAVREQDISKQSGLIFRGLSCQPILRVQHVEVKRGPLDRWAGLAKLQVFSAGGEMHTFEIPGLPLEHAEQIRQFILDHKDVSAR
jgi:membrane protein YdbS with pleckstrin-like domain